MKDMFADFRNERLEIDLLGFAIDRYGQDNVSIAAMEYIEDIQSICPIRSRQAAAMIIATARTIL